MADPKIKYDIEAVVKGDADAEQLAKALRDVGDALDGDLKVSATEAAQALDALGSKQRAIDAFVTLRRETQQLSTDLNTAVGAVDRLGNEVQDSAAKTQAAAAAEKAAAAAVKELQGSLQSKRDALRTTREESTRAQKQTAEYRATVDGLKASIKAASNDLKQRQADQRTATRASQEAQNAEAALRKEYDLAVGSAAKLSSSLRSKNMALDASRQSMQAMGLSTTGLTQQQRSLQTAVEQVRTQVTTLAPAYQQAAAASTQSTQVQAQNQRTLREGMTSISTQLQRIQQIATVAVGGGYFGGLIKDVAATADEFKNLEARIKIATGEGTNFETSFAGVTRIALETHSALDETGTLFTRLAKASQEGGMAAVQAQERALGLTQTINQAAQLSGGSAESAKAAITQLIQGLQSGVLRGEEFNSVMEQAPRLAQAMAQGLGVTTGELRTLANQGALTAETVMKALEGQADAVAGEFAKLPPTVGRALQDLSTQWTLYVGAADKGLISSANAAKVIDALAANLDVLVNALTAAGKVWVGLNIMSWVGQFTAWAKSTLTATATLEANTAAAAGNAAAQRASATAQAQNTAAQVANTAATTANTAARAANAKAWGDISAFARGASAAQDMATAAAARNTAAVAANASSVAKAGVVWRATSALFGPWGIAAALLAPEIVGIGKALGEGAAKAMGYGKMMQDAEAKMRAAEEAAKAQAEATRRQAALYEEARNRSFDLTKQSTGLIAEFDKLTKAGDSTAEALAKIGKDFDVSNSEGIRAMSTALDKLRADGKITATEFQTAWAQALDGQDLAKFEVLARNAFAAVGIEADKLRDQLNKAIESGASEEVVRALRRRLEGAMAAASREGERVATMMDNVLREAVRRTGLEYDQLQGKIGAASRSAINDVEAIVVGMDRLKAQGIDAGRVLTASLTKAIQTADSQQAIDALRSRVEQLRSTLGNKITDGLLDQIKLKAEEVADALDKATPGVNSLREAMQQLGITSDATLKSTATNAKAAYDTMLASGKASARELSEGFKKAADDAIAANKGIAPSWVTAQAAVRGYKIEVDGAGRTTLVSMKDAKSAVDSVGASARSAAGEFSNLAAQAQYASREAQALANAGQHLAAAFAQRNADVSNSSITKTQGTTNPVDLVPTFNSRAEAEAWKEKWLEQYHKENNFMNKGQLGYYMKDLTMFEYEGELKALELREAMEAAKKKAETENGTGGGSGGGTGGGSGGGSGGGQRVDRVVNVYIGNSQAYSVPTTLTGQQNIEALAREVIRVLEQQRAQLGV